MQESEVQHFVIKYSIISAMITWILANYMKDFGDCLIDGVLKPFFSLDLDDNGEPDMQQLQKFTVQISNMKFPIGRIIFGLIKILLHLVLIYIFIYILVRYSGLIKM